MDIGVLKTFNTIAGGYQTIQKVFDGNEYVLVGLQ